MKGYITKDKDNSLWFHYIEPHRMNDIEETWWGSNDWSFELDPEKFPEFDNLKWEDEPVEVELTITKNK